VDDLEGSLDDAIKKLQNLKTEVLEKGGLAPFLFIDPYVEGFGGYLYSYLVYYVPLTEAEIIKKEKERVKVVERRKRQKENQKIQDMKRLEALAKKLGKKIV